MAASTRAKVLVAAASATLAVPISVFPQQVAQGADIITTIPVAPNSDPEGIAVGPDGTAYSANSASATVSRIPAQSRVVAEALPTAGALPYSVAVDSTGKVFVTNRSSDTIARIDPGRFAVPRTIPVGDQPWGVIVAPNDAVFATTNGSDTVVRIDRGSNIVSSTIPLLPGSAPKDLAYSPHDRQLYVADSGTSTVARINPVSGAVRYLALPMGAQPRGIAVAKDGSVYVTDIGLEAVHWFPPDSEVVRTTTSYPAGTFPSDAAADPDGSVLVSLYDQSQLVRFRAGAPVATIDLGADKGPDRVAVGADGVAYTADFSGNSVTRIDPGPRPQPATASVKTRSAVKIHRRSAVLRGRVTTAAEQMTVRMRIARNRALTRKVKVLPVRAVPADTSQSLRKSVTGLKRHRSYWYRAEGVAGGIQVDGTLRRFRTR